jgi:hypothetical protein
VSELIDGLEPNGKLIVVGGAFEPIEVTPIQLVNGSKAIQGRTEERRRLFSSAVFPLTWMVGILQLHCG